MEYTWKGVFRNNRTENADYWMEIYLKGIKIYYIVAFYPLTLIKQNQKKEAEIDKKEILLGEGGRAFGFFFFLYKYGFTFRSGQINELTFSWHCAFMHTLQAGITNNMYKYSQVV